MTSLQMLQTQLHSLAKNVFSGSEGGNAKLKNALHFYFGGSSESLREELKTLADTWIPLVIQVA